MFDQAITFVQELYQHYYLGYPEFWRVFWAVAVTLGIVWGALAAVGILLVLIEIAWNWLWRGLLIRLPVFLWRVLTGKRRARAGRPTAGFPDPYHRPL